MTATVKPTPGPWSVDADQILGFGDVVHVATVTQPAESAFLLDREAEANAALIAAAPEMLVACELFDQCVRSGRITQEAIDATRAALAKAKGGAS